MPLPKPPRLLRKIGWIPRPSAWAGRKAEACERWVGGNRLGRLLLESSGTIGHLMVALLFPSICVARKTG